MCHFRKPIDENEEEDCLSKNQYVPLSIICQPTKASWFPNQSLLKLKININYYDNKNLYHKLLCVFAIHPKDYPLIQEINFRKSLILSQVLLESKLFQSIHMLKVLKPEIQINPPFEICGGTLQLNLLQSPKSSIKLNNIKK